MPIVNLVPGTARRAKLTVSLVRCTARRAKLTAGDASAKSAHQLGDLVAALRAKLKWRRASAESATHRRGDTAKSRHSAKAPRKGAEDPPVQAVMPSISCEELLNEYQTAAAEVAAAAVAAASAKVLYLFVRGCGL